MIVHVHLHRTIAPGPYAGTMSVDVAGDQSPLAELRGRPLAPPAFAGLTWSEDPLPVGDAAWRVERRVAWDDGPAGADPGGWIKQVSLVRRRPDLSPAEFRDRYLGHAEVARAHHGMFRYAQSVVVDTIRSEGSGTDSSRPDGISELWFRDRTHWLEGFYTGPDSAAAVRADTERFIDFATTASIIAMPAAVDLLATTASIIAIPAAVDLRATTDPSDLHAATDPSDPPHTEIPGSHP